MQGAFFHEHRRIFRARLLVASRFEQLHDNNQEAKGKATRPLKDSSSKSTRRIPPFIAANDLARGGVQVAQSALQFLLMLAVMYDPLPNVWHLSLLVIHPLHCSERQKHTNEYVNVFDDHVALTRHCAAQTGERLPTQGAQARQLAQTKRPHAP